MTRFLSMVLILAAIGQALPVNASTLDNDPERQIVVTISNSSGPGLGGAASTWKGWAWTGGYRLSVGAIGTARSIAEDYGLEEVDAWPITTLNEYCVVYLLGPDADRAMTLAAMAGDSRIRIAQPLNLFSTAAFETSADTEPYSALQHGLRALNMRNLHSVATGRRVRVAVVDTGAQLEHPDIRRNIADHADFVRKAGDDFSDDIHGTAVSGIIAAAAGNQEGIVGVAPDADLVLLKACWPVREGSADARCNSFTLARAIEAARDRKADVLNLSLGGPNDQLLSELLYAAIEDGISVVGAEPEDQASQPFPSSVEGVIAVRGSNREIRAQRASIPAPGNDIITTVPVAEYQYLSGNSLAVAHVSGLVALLRQLDKRLTPSELADILYSTSPALEPAGRSISACDALAQIDERIRCESS